MRAVRTLLLLAVVVGCAWAPERTALIECACPRGEPPVHQISLTAPTGNWGCSPHSLGLYREVDWVAIKLPAKPPAGEVQYEHAQLVLSQGYPRRNIEMTVGFVRLDASHKLVTLSLQVADGNFWANGVYPAHEFAPSADRD